MQTLVFLLPLFFILPLVACLFFGACKYFKFELQIKNIARVFSFFYFLIALTLFFLVRSNGTIVYNFADWPFPAGIQYIADKLSVTFVLLTSIASLLSHYYLPFYRYDNNNPILWCLFHGMHAGIFGAFLTADFFNLFVAFEIFLILSYGLIINLNLSIRSILPYILLNVIASSVLLLAEAVLYSSIGSLNMGEVAIIVAKNPSLSMHTFVFSLFLVVAILKSGAAPFFQWMPEAYSNLPAGLVAFFSAMLTKVGIYLMIRMGINIFPHQAHEFSNTMIIIGVLSIFIGVLAALGQKNIKKLLAFHSVSQIGYIIVGIGYCYKFSTNVEYLPMAITGVLIYVVHHSLVKSALFAVTGAVELSSGNDQLSNGTGYINKYPWLAYGFLAAAFPLAGLPPSSGFLAKFNLLKVIALQKDYLLIFALIIGGILTLSSMLKIWIYCISGPEQNISPNKHFSRLKFPILLFVFASWLMPIGLKPVLKWFNQIGKEMSTSALYQEQLNQKGKSINRSLSNSFFKEDK